MTKMMSVKSDNPRPGYSDLSI